MHQISSTLPQETNQNTVSKPTFRRNIFIVLMTILLLSGYFAAKPIKAFLLPAVSDNIPDYHVYIPTGSSFEDVVLLLKRGGFIKDENNFRWLAAQMNYKKDKMRAGRFEVKPGWSNRQLIQQLRNGEQDPIKVVLNSERLPEDVAGKVARFIETDSLSLLSVFRDNNFLKQYNLTDQTLLTAFIPNTYEMYWNTDARGFVGKMVKEYDLFWGKNDREARATELGLSKQEVYIVASIVERETNAVVEKPTIAGVYLNRLNIGMKLQADPTSVFATRDFAARRVTDYHTNFDSPYNTYRYFGLPPGPISMASIPSLEAVLSPEKHQYLYFCAKPDESGTHAFAASFAAHKVNADRFQAFIRQKNRAL